MSTIEQSPTLAIIETDQLPSGLPEVSIGESSLHQADFEKLVADVESAFNALGTPTQERLAALPMSKPEGSVDLNHREPN